MPLENLLWFSFSKLKLYSSPWTSNNGILLALLYYMSGYIFFISCLPASIINFISTSFWILYLQYLTNINTWPLFNYFPNTYLFSPSNVIYYHNFHLKGKKKKIPWQSNWDANWNLLTVKLKVNWKLSKIAH